MTTLAANINASTKKLQLDAAFAVNSAYPIPITVGSEHMAVNNRLTDSSGDHWIQVDRGQDGTTPATHSSGATVTTGWGGGGGGSTSVTDGTTTVSDVTSIEFPAGTVADLGSGVAGVGLVLAVASASVAFDAAGFVNPENSVGVPLFELPAGSRALVVGYVTTTFDASGGELALFVGASAGSAANHQLPSISVEFADVDADVMLQARPYILTIAQQIAGSSQALASNDVQDVRDKIGAVGFSAFQNAIPGRSRWVYALNTCTVFAAYYPSGANPTTGAASFDAIIATPAS